MFLSPNKVGSAMHSKHILLFFLFQIDQIYLLVVSKYAFNYFYMKRFPATIFSNKRQRQSKRVKHDLPKRLGLSM